MSGVQVTTRRETAPVTAAGTALDRWGRALQRLPLHLSPVVRHSLSLPWESLSQERRPAVSSEPQLIRDYLPR